MAVPGHGLSWAGTYEAFAHIWVGVVGTLAVLWWGTEAGWWCAAALLSLSLFEAAMFAHGVRTGKFKVLKGGPL